MQIQPNHHGSPESAHRAFERAKAEVQRENQDRVRDARAELARLSHLRHEKYRQFRAQQAEAASADRVEISEHARMLASEEVEAFADRQGSEARAERLAEIRAQLDAGSLHTPERVEQAARRLLGHEAE